jgi:hypothetical protein
MCMDFVFNCASCRGPLIARANLRGFRVQCAHCSGGIEVVSAKPVTDAVANALLDAPLPFPPKSALILRRVRPATCCSSAVATRGRDRLPRAARISVGKKS